MVAFRKAFPALAVVAFFIGTATNASAQTTPLVCDTNAGVPPLVRAEGHTELVGDIVLECRGGTNLPAFAANFQLFLNTNITSRLLADGLSEALLLIDEAGNGTTPFCVSPGFTSNPTGVVGTAASPTCNPGPVGPGTTFQTGTYNAFRAQPTTAANGTANASVVWAGVPIVPPGTNGTRRIRITNIRANASAVPASASLVPSQIFAFLSISGTQSLALNNPQQNVAFVLQGLQFDITSCTGGTAAFNFQQCQTQPTGTSQLGLRFREGFQTAFKTRVTAGQQTSAPGVVYNTESGFVRPELGAIAGLADTGTRVAARFTNVPEGVRLFVSTVSFSNSTNNLGTPGAQAVLVQGTGATGAGGFAGTPVTDPVAATCNLTDANSAEVVLTGAGNARGGVAVWEVTSADPANLDTLFFALNVAFTANTPNASPGIGQSSITGSFAPFYAAGVTAAGAASSGLPIPRFIDNARATNAFAINQCVTNLLFPFVTNREGFDTGIAISNTSLDPFAGNAGRGQSGTCTMNYYGGVVGGPAPPAFTTTTPVAAGATLAFTLMGGGGGGMQPTPGFQGYIIATCRFQYAHGFAFITDGPVGQATVAEGYLALVMDTPTTTTRTGTASESLGN